ncbi:hypothetical protein D9Q98_009678 [Chlorella vulgaris]|uniref:Uncharacterized protein n=1 Tax=Chlorella vulgaris TaxID=3077 RepID=A0A9D4TEU3_CHLVU|nr:hypothetical protein D9Q98_009678 [Chlorella vulgaris]
MCCPQAARPAQKPLDRPVTAADVQKVHVALERCIQRGMSMMESVQLLSRLGVAPKLSMIVWHRLELENKEFFALYQSQLEATAELESFHM